MKKIIFLFLLLSLFSCSPKSELKKSKSFSYDKIKDLKAGEYMSSYCDGSYLVMRVDNGFIFSFSGSGSLFIEEKNF